MDQIEIPVPKMNFDFFFVFKSTCGVAVCGESDEFSSYKRGEKSVSSSARGVKETLDDGYVKESVMIES